MFTNRKIAFIGSGVMAEAMIAGLLRQGSATVDSLIAAEPRPERLTEIVAHYGIDATPDNAIAVRHADVVVLSVKPQSLDKALASLKGAIKSSTLILSIVAGAPIEKINAGLNHAAIVRCMPNTPGQIGEGITVWTASPAVSDDQRRMALIILQALGDEVFVEEENYLDMATALSGSGPAYVFLFMEALIDAGVHLGFHRSIAERLVTQTVRGSVDYYLSQQEQSHPASLRNQVTSPAGTTAAALYYLEKAGFRTAISRAIWAAYERSQELGKSAKARPPENS
ncbi:MAG: pyrroline-5-carboxylate reductase [Chloroflexota bacterium]